MRLATLLILLLLMCGCTTMVPRKNLPYPLSTADSGDPVKVVSIPLPVIATSPNEGMTTGALTAFLIHNNKDEVSTLVAPQINYNENFGLTGTIYGAFYPTPEVNWEMNLSRSSNVNQDYEIKFRDKRLLNSNHEVNLFAYLFDDGSARFFGFQSESRQANESNYDASEIGVTASVGYFLTPHFQILVGERFRKVEIKRGAVESLPFIRDIFDERDVPGINGFTVHAPKLALIYSTLDSRDMPTTGLYAKASMEVSSRALGSTAEYRHYEAEIKGYYPLRDAKYISVGRLVYNQTLGNDVPFLERSILGGETTLRGYGRNRFIDSSYLLCNLEERIRLFRLPIFNVNVDWEIAPFIDLGAVMDRLNSAETKNFQFNPGIGFRGVVRPNIVGRIDIGLGQEGPAVFVGLGYPF